MAPPPYADLGKQARDVFNRGYNFGQLKLDVKTKTEPGVDFVSGVVSNQETGKVSGSLETKYKLKDTGITFTERWNTDNLLTTEIAIQDQLLKGLKLSADCTFAPHSGQKSGHLKAAYVHDTCALNFDADMKSGGPFLTASAVLGYQGFLAGYQAKFETKSSKITANNIALGYIHSDFIVHACVNNGEEYNASVHHKVNSDLDIAFELNWSSRDNNETHFGIASKYALDSNASVRAKINNAGQLGLGYQQKLRQGITLTLSSLIDVMNFNQGGHKLGIGLEMEA